MAFSTSEFRLRCRWTRAAMVAMTLLTITLSSEETLAQESALVFDGIDDVATVPNTNQWPILTSSLTVEMWVRPADLSVNEYIAMIWGGDRYGLSQRSTDTSQLAWTISRGPTDSAFTPTGALVEGRWDHFAGTYDGVTMRIYQNGALVGQKDHTAPGSVNVRGELLIGLWPGQPTFAGTIDEVRLWLSVRSQEQIARWMGRPLTGDEPDLVGYWRFDEGSGQVISDSSLIDNDGVRGITSSAEPEDPSWTTDAAPIAFFFDGFESGDTSAWTTTR